MVLYTVICNVMCNVTCNVMCNAQCNVQRAHWPGQVAAAMCDNPEARRAAFGALVHYRVFKYILSVALAGLASDGRKPLRSWCTVDQLLDKSWPRCL